MFPLKKLFVVFFIVLFWSYEGNAQYLPDAILLADVKNLTLKKGQYTSYRRGLAIPQLQCVGGSAGCSDTPDVVQCTNVGFNGTDYQWECKADLNKKYRFGNIVVSCEGYNYPEDPYILRGSCGMKYVLDRTDIMYFIVLLVIIFLIGIIACISLLVNKPHKRSYDDAPSSGHSFSNNYWLWGGDSDSSNESITLLGFGGTERR